MGVRFVSDSSEQRGYIFCDFLRSATAEPCTQGSPRFVEQGDSRILDSCRALAQHPELHKCALITVLRGNRVGPRQLQVYPPNILKTRVMSSCVFETEVARLTCSVFTLIELIISDS